MAQTELRAVVTARDDASPVLSGVSRGIENVGKSSASLSERLRENTLAFGAMAAGAGVALNRLTGFLGDTINEANRYQAALLGLNSVSNAFGQSSAKAERAARDLAEDGLMSVTDAATGLKNLLASGFSLDQATTLMKRFKDSAAFGRQSALSFGQAVASATEGIKNGNSILVDNAGVTKNLSVILTEAGFSAQDLMKATTDASVRQALFNGILKETNPQLGDAAKLAESAAGKQAMMAAQTQILKTQIGESLQPALLKLLQAITPIIEKFAKFTEDHPGLVSAILLITTGVTGLIVVLGSLGLALSGIPALFSALAIAGKGAMAAISLATTGTQAVLGGLSAFVGGPAMLGIWGIMAAAAIAAFVSIQNKANETRNVLDETARGVEKSTDSQIVAIKRLGELKKTGTPEQKKRATEALRQIQGFAGGTDYFRGGMALVGEKGPELVNLPKGSSITPSQRTERIVNSSQPVNITIQAGAFMGSQQDARKYAMMIMSAYKDAQMAKGMA